ncbi:cytochrome P450 4C1-like [Penaeus vannamei]|uniref:cytochrome P450 4C1-like n=1 Tax=Penaeus vannamei TaxID=6689 RepID=UPI00387F5F6E
MQELEEERSWLALGSPGLPTYVLLTTLLAAAMAWLYKKQQKVWLVEQIPGPKALPLIGNSLFFWGGPEVLFKQLYKVTEFGAVARFWLGPNPYCVLSSAKAVESILSSQRHLHKSWDYTLLHPWLGEGLITSAGSKWHSRRKLLTPAFHFKILEDFVDVFTSQTDTLVKRLRAKADGRPFDVFHCITLCALDIICETAMGRRVNAQEDSESEFVKAVHDLSSLIQFRQFRPWLHPDFVFRRTSHGRKHDACIKTIHGLAKQTISMRRKARRAKRFAAQKKAPEEDFGQKTRQAFLDLLLEYSENDSTITNEDILEEVNTFMFAGHDTTTAAMNWFLYVMGTHKEIQTRVQEELDAVFQGSDRPATMADLRELKYLELCLKESLRVFPPVPMIIREVKEEIQINNYRIPAGTSVVIHVYRLHRDPEQFPNPEVFDPDRFLPENCNKRHPYAYVPFSAGPRNCIGQKFAQLEMKVVLSSILRNFRVESDIPWEEMRVHGELILRPKEGNPLKLHPRK